MSTSGKTPLLLHEVKVELTCFSGSATWSDKRWSEPSIFITTTEASRLVASFKRQRRCSRRKRQGDWLSCSLSSLGVTVERRFDVNYLWIRMKEQYFHFISIVAALLLPLFV